MKITLNILVVLAVMIIGMIWLQIFLSKKENKWFGLILPLTTFAYSLLMVFSIYVTDSMTNWEVFGIIASTLFIANIPTIILLGVYFGCREKIKRKKALEKMNIQDLE